MTLHVFRNQSNYSETNKLALTFYFFSALIYLLKVVCTSTEDFVDDLRKEIIGNSFNEELGFMHEIKKEVTL